MTRAWKMIGGIFTLTAILIGGSIGNLIGREAANAAMGPDLDTVLAKTASTLNATLPMMVDRITRLDNTVPGPGKKFSYFYTLPAYSSAELDPVSTMAALRSGVKQNTCGATDMKGFFKNGVSVVYVYRGNDAREIGRVTVTPADCGYAEIREVQAAPKLVPVDYEPEPIDWSKARRIGPKVYDPFAPDYEAPKKVEDVKPNPFDQFDQ